MNNLITLTGDKLTVQLTINPGTDTAARKTVTITW